MFKLQIGQYGEAWKPVQEYPSEWIARKAFSTEALEDLAGFVPSELGRYELRLLNEEGLVIEHWMPSEEGYPYIAMLSANPFLELQESYGLNDNLMIALCQRYLRSKGLNT